VCPVANEKLARPMRLLAALLALGIASACHRPVAHLKVPQQSAVALTGGTTTSMIYVARTSEGVLVIDLGWTGYRRPLKHALEELGVTNRDVRWVFVTHAHRDHVSAWRAFRSATFFLAEPEVPLFVGKKLPRAWIPRIADRLKPPGRPRAGEIALHSFNDDTTFVFGSDTLRAYLVTGHTAGSAAYLFRGTLFAGDAVSWATMGEFGPAMLQYSDRPRAADRNLARLWTRLPSGGVRYVCTAHARCALFTPQFLEDVAR
jgi:hydroxyacylglutathione hydrolase